MSWAICRIINGNYDGGFASKDEAIQAGREAFKGQSFYVGESKPLEFSGAHLHILGVATADDLVTRIRRVAYHKVGEISEHWCISAEDRAELEDGMTTLLRKWVEKHPSNIFTVGSPIHIVPVDLAPVIPVQDEGEGDQ